MSNYIPVIGLEIHMELKTKTKMFCDCLNDPDEKRPNINVCPICLAHPGVLPAINKKAVEAVLKLGLALNSEISEMSAKGLRSFSENGVVYGASKFDRKNYFYPDLPKGYQISQYDKPLLIGGELNDVRIRRIHLEEDTGRLLHANYDNDYDHDYDYDNDVNDYSHRQKSLYSLVDFNRAGVPLMELVTEPDIKSSKEAVKFAKELQLILRYLEISDADMEKGQMRVEVNISLRPMRETDAKHNAKLRENNLGTKVEIKNLNSFRAVQESIDYEIKRQTEILEKGGEIKQETRGWNDVHKKTIHQRFKEEAHDYRYFPEPDLPSLQITSEMIQEIKAEIPELPQQKRERFQKEYQLDEKSIEFFVYNKSLGEYFEKTISELREWVKAIEIKGKVEEEEFLKLVKLCSNYLIADLQGLLKGASVTGEDFLITPENFAEFITLIYEGKISSKIAKTILNEMFSTGADPSHIIEEKGLVQITDETEIEKIIKEVISQNPKAVEDFKKGKETALQFLIGKAMSVTKGKANPELVNRILKKELTR